MSNYVWRESSQNSGTTN